MLKIQGTNGCPSQLDRALSFQGDFGNPDNLDRDISNSDGVIEGTRGKVISNLRSRRDSKTGAWVGYYVDATPEVGTKK